LVKDQRQALEKDWNANRFLCQRPVRVVLQHKDLTLVRNPALNQLPAGERKDWESLWEAVDSLLEKADAQSPEPPGREKP
jgi:hypothetical protein